MEERIKKLEQEIEELKTYVSDKKIQQISLPLDDTSTIIITDKINPPIPQSTSTAPTQNISLTGNAQTITVPAQPTGSYGIKINGTIYYFLYK